MIKYFINIKFHTVIEKFNAFLMNLGSDYNALIDHYRIALGQRSNFEDGILGSNLP